MPYQIVKRSGKRPWKIINKQTGMMVGSSMTRKMAGMSVAHRMGAMGEAVKAGLTKRRQRKSIKKGKK
jgi:hypothetical protein